LGGPNLFKIFRRAEIGISPAPTDQFFDNDLIDVFAVALLIRAIVAFIAIGGIAFVGFKAEALQLFDELVAAAFDRAFGIGILETEKEDAMALLGDGIAN